jgi:hypothetical protein
MSGSHRQPCAILEGAMEPIQVNAVLLRGLLPDLRLAPGTRLVGRVIERHGDHGLLNLAGAVLVARLPAGVEAGQRLRLAVAEVTPEQVVLRIVAETAPAPQAGPPPRPPAPAGAPPIPLALPGGVDARVRVQVDPDGAAPGRARGARDAPAAVTVRYDSPRLGRIDVRLALSARGLDAGVAVPPGEAAALAGERAGALRDELRRTLGRPVEVHVGVRRDRVDVRA